MSSLMYPSSAPSPRGWRVGAMTDAELPDPNVEWTWAGQQAFAVATARRVNALETQMGDARGLSLVLAAAVGLLAGGAAAWGFSQLRR